MAKTSSFLFTNTTAGSNTITPIDLELVDNYAIQKETASQCDLTNKTAPIDAQELVGFRCVKIDKVNNDLNIRYPAPVRQGVNYGVLLQETLVTTDDSDASFRVDEPIVVSLNIRHPYSGNFDNTVVGTAVLRAISTLMKEDGSWRFDDLMRSSERPVVN